MNRRPGQLNVTTEVAFCSFCARPRTLRREERQLGALVRTTITCETCHRTLESSVTVADAAAQATAAEPEAPGEAPEKPAPEPRPRARSAASTPARAKPKPAAKSGPTTSRRTAKGK
ncbi:MAG TPA: hypothetical protein VET26_12200 [Candidatus Sulfotelmatobacter sp.]|nr:hypothetical protein [Candidatus Sulfotelmatobacter sp.]